MPHRAHQRLTLALFALLLALPAAAVPPLCTAPEWLARYRPGPNDFVDPRHLAVDPDGGAYGLARIFHPNFVDHWVTVRFNVDGSVAWADEVDGPASVSDVPRRILVAPDRSVVAMGEVDFGVGSSDVGVVRYTPEGSRIYMRVVSYAGAATHTPLTHAADSDGSVYVGGAVAGFDWMAFKLNPTGATVWQERLEDGLVREILPLSGGRAALFGDLDDAPTCRIIGPLGSEEAEFPIDAYGAAVTDPDGRLYVAGSEPVAGRMRLTGYAADGQILWQSTRVDDRVFPQSMIRDGEGNLYVLAVILNRTATGATINRPLLLSKLSSTGQLLWERVWTNDLCGDSNVQGELQQAPNGDILFRTASLPVNGGAVFDHTVLRYTADGMPVESRRLPAPDPIAFNGMNWPVGLDAAGNQYSLYRQVIPTSRRGFQLAMEVQKHPNTGVPTGGIAATNARKINFGTVKVGQIRAKTLTLVNRGATECLSVDFSTLHAPFYGGGVYTLPPRGKLKVTLRMAPPVPGDFAEPLAIATSDPARPQLTLQVSGRGK